MTSLRVLAAVTALAALAACDSAPPQDTPEQTEAPPAAAVERAPMPSTQPPAAPVPGIAAPEAAVAIAAPVPAPISQRPLTRDQMAAMQPLFGRWAAGLDNCERGAITISRTRFEGAENGCDITSLVDTGNWNFVATLSCMSQGQTARERIGMVPLYAPTGEAVGLTYFDRDNQAVTVYRCD